MSSVTFSGAYFNSPLGIISPHYPRESVRYHNTNNEGIENLDSDTDYADLKTYTCSNFFTITDPNSLQIKPIITAVKIKGISLTNNIFTYDTANDHGEYIVYFKYRINGGTTDFTTIEH